MTKQVVGVAQRVLRVDALIVCQEIVDGLSSRDDAGGRVL